MTRRNVLVLALLVTYFMLPGSAHAHSFGKLYNLPVPFWMYLYGGVAAIVASFLVIGFFIKKTNASIVYPVINLSKWRAFSFLTSPNFWKILKIESVFLFFLTVVTGTFGTDLPSFNFNMTFFWILFVLGLTYLTAFVGNIYAVVNPFKAIIEWVERILGEEMKGFAQYPKRLQYYPAFLFYILFIWIELFAGTTPITLSFLIVLYFFISVGGVILFGKEAWFRYGDFFSLFFRLIGNMAFIEHIKNKLYLRPPIIGLLKRKAEHFSVVLFILFMLSSTAFDGFRSTAPWSSFWSMYVLDTAVPILGDASYQIFESLGLLLSPFFFLAIYLGLLYLAKVVTQSTLSLKDLALEFAFSLLPIAVVYNAAHYYTLIVTEGQNVIRLISDPFGFDWNLFGTASYRNVFFLDANFTWHSQVVLILAGHIAGVYLAHLVALKVFPKHKHAIISQVPMLVLMVVYTMIGLWILSQPITSGG